ncbi:hypothetical protein P692DRAFT_20278107 [Suillus brevipes Sb2]|nr:hypothetical protein P692DRAFT_20278107 [Suillus brevipes Sb2]
MVSESLVSGFGGFVWIAVFSPVCVIIVNGFARVGASCLEWSEVVFPISALHALAVTSFDLIIPHHPSQHRVRQVDGISPYCVTLGDCRCPSCLLHCPSPPKTGYR